MSEGTSGNGDDKPVPDDEIERQLRALMDETETAARLKEPSADERQKVAGRARKKTAKTAKRTQRQIRKAQRKAWGRRRSHKAAWSWVVAIVIIAGAGTFAYTKAGHTLTAAITRAGGAGGPDDTQLVTNGAVPATATSPSLSPLTASGPPADPFAGTPADKWANGEAGIVIPKAEPVGDYSASQVEEAYEKTRQLLVAAGLDKQTLDGGAPTHFADLLAGEDRTQFTDGLNKTALGKNHEPESTRQWVTQFAPGTTKIIGTVIKVHGTMKAITAENQGEPILRVNVDYIFTYPIEPPKDPSDWMRIVAQFQGHVDFGSWAGSDSSFAPWWDVSSSFSGERCGMADGFIHPDYESGPADSVTPSGPPVDPYSLATTPTADGCGMTTGT